MGYISTAELILLSLFFFRSSLVDHHDEHVDNIRQFHKTLREKESAMLSNCTKDMNPSSSALFSALRYQLSFCSGYKLSCEL